MKTYMSPSVEVISLQTDANIAYENPLETAVVSTANGKITTTYNMALLADGSQF